jgi:hypothetical protein
LDFSCTATTPDEASAFHSVQVAGFDRRTEKNRMTTNQNTNTVAGSTSKAKTIGGTDTVQPEAQVEEAELLWRPTREQEIRNRAYEIYLQRGAESGDEAQDWFQAERELTE